MSTMVTLADILSNTARAMPKRTAAVEGGVRMDYESLLAASRSIAAFMGACGVEAGGRVALLLPNSIELVAAVFGAPLVGAVCVPINPVHTLEEVGYYLESSSAGLLLTDSGSAGSARAAAPPQTRVSVVKGEGSEWSPAESPGTLPGTLGPSGGDPALHLYSTGSTGTPKRVTRSHRNLVRLARNYALTVGWTEDDRVLFTIPLSHTYGLGNMLGAVRVGASLYLVNGGSRSKVLDLIETGRITVFPSVPFMLGVLAVTYMPKPRDFASLGMVISAGSPLSEGVFTRFSEKFGIAPRQLYGSTETGVIAVNTSPDVGARSASVGRPVEEVTVRVVREDGTECTVDEVGEITVSSPTVVEGYDGLPEETARVFIDGYYHTGDLGRLDSEGYIYIEGRKNLVINVAGNKVDPRQVEDALLEHPMVGEAVVLRGWGPGGEECVRAVIVPLGEVSRQDIVEFMRARVAGFKIPRVVDFTDSLPKSPTGKVLLSRL